MPHVVLKYLGSNSKKYMKPTLQRMLLRAPWMKMLIIIVFRSLVTIIIVYMSRFKVMPAAKIHLRPYMSPKRGSQRSVLAQPTKSAVPKRAYFQLGAHIISSLSCQL